MSDLIKISEKNTFAIVQKIIVQSVMFVALCILLANCGNQGSEEYDTEENEMVHDMISSNLLKIGDDVTIDPALLIGEWDCVKFAYTADGIKIFDVVKITSATLVIPVAPTEPVCEVYDQETGMHSQTERWILQRIYNGGSWLCSLSGNLINLTFCGATKMGVPNPHEENDIVWALDNAKSFVIKGNELMIFFTGDEENKGFTSIAGERKINLLILKKR